MPKQKQEALFNSSLDYPIYNRLYINNMCDEVSTYYHEEASRPVWLIFWASALDSDDFCI